MQDIPVLVISACIKRVTGMQMQIKWIAVALCLFLWSDKTVCSFFSPQQPNFQNSIATKLPLRLILPCQIWLKLGGKLKNLLEMSVGAQSLKSHFLRLKQ